MTNRTTVPGPEDEGTAQTTRDSPRNRALIYSGLLDIKKSKSTFKFFLVLLLLSYFLGFCWISWVSPILELYGRGEEMLYTDISLQTRIFLSNQQPSKIQKEIFQSRLIPQPSSVRCSSLIDGVGAEKVNRTQRHGNEILCCDRSHLRTDVCYLSGDVRTHSQSSSVFLYSHDNKTTREEKIRPYTRKWESSVMSTIDEVNLKILSRTDHESEQQNSCQVQHSVPAMVFSTGGYTGNVYHEFNDGLLPLYITSQHLQGEIVFVILEYHDWWMMKYQDLVKQLSKYPVIDFRGDKRVHCFPEMIVGMKIHDELTVDPSLMKDGKTIRDFQSLLGKAYAPPRLSAMVGFTNLINESSTVPLHGLNSTSASMNLSNVLVPSALKPKLVIISRPKSRVMLNQKGIVRLAEKIGFQVEVLNPNPTTEMVEMFRALNSCDVMLGVHGAAMTHFLLMRPGSVFIQIVPLGTDWAAATYYGQPAMKLGLKYMEYKIVPEESSLYESYERNDPVLTDPDSINSKGWWETKKVYLDGQNVRPSLKRLKKFLVNAYSYSLSSAQGITDVGNLQND